VARTHRLKWMFVVTIGAFLVKLFGDCYREFVGVLISTLKKPRAKGSMVDPIPLLVVAGLVLLLVTWVWRRFRGRVAASRWTFLRT
jgi:hypothetical protein